MAQPKLAKKQDGFLKSIYNFFNTLFKVKELTVIFFVMAILAIIIVPLPTFVLDFMLTLSIAFSLFMLLISFFVAKPTDLNAFPTMILLVTLYRLALSVATTRMILADGYMGPEAVSHLIASFGSFVLRGNFVVGIIIFIILVVINFMVVTSGSGRVAEVAARFTLDAMPGKQMAIDADLNAGMIDEPTARRRRLGLQEEAGFYGAMDGASKFVSGDAKAGIIITIVNIIAGFLIGVFQHDMTMASAAKNFTVLTIGDGLIMQIPGLIVSTAVGILITRATGQDDEVQNKPSFAENIVNQLIQDYKILFTVGFILLLFAMVPGLPTLSLFLVGSCFVALGYSMMSGGKIDIFGQIKKITGQDKKDKPRELTDEEKIEQHKANQKPKKTAEEIREEEERAIDDLLKVEVLELNLGYGLIKLADANQGGDLLERVRSMRRKIAGDFGFVMPQVRIRDNLSLNQNTYQIMLKGVEIGSGIVYPDKFMVIDNGLFDEEIKGISAKDPAYGLDVKWIDAADKEIALIQGASVFDPSTVIATHLTELVKKHAAEILSRQDTQLLVEKLKRDYPTVVDECMRVANIGLIQRILKQLLSEKIPIRDMLTIMETIAEVAEITKNVDILVEQVRAKLSRVITKLYSGDDGVMRLMNFDSGSEHYMLERLKDQNGNRSLMLNVQEIHALVEGTNSQAKLLMEKGIHPVVVIVDPMLRKSLAEIYERFGLDIVVLSHAEIDQAAKFEVLGVVSPRFIG